MKKPLSISLILFFAISSLTFNAGCKKESTTGSVVTSHTFPASSWNFSSPNYYIDLSVPELTSSSVNSAVVMAYFSKNAGTWVAIPYTEYGTFHDYHMNFLYSANTVEIRWFYDDPSSNGDDPNTHFSTTIQCKVVVIPESARMTNPDLDLTNYNAVKTRFNLPN